MKKRDWRKLLKLPKPADGSGSGETRWVFPDDFFDQLPAVLKDAPALPGEGARCSQVLALIDAAGKDPALHNWTTQNNGCTVQQGLFHSQRR